MNFFPLESTSTWTLLNVVNYATFDFYVCGYLFSEVDGFDLARVFVRLHVLARVTNDFIFLPYILVNYDLGEAKRLVSGLFT